MQKNNKAISSASGRLHGNDDVRQLIHAEAKFFDRCALCRSQEGRISYQADIRRATRVIGRPRIEPVDPKMFEIQQGQYRDRYLDLIAYKPGGRVLEIGCGPGWLALELGRRGQIVDAYDISEKAIVIARQMLEENPFKEGFGEVRYHLKDVTQENLSENTYDAISGWSAFHHMPDFHAFMNKIDRALKPGGIIATMDDYPRRRLEINLQRFFGLVLPTTERSYGDKLVAIANRITGKTIDSPEVFSPMEEAKYSTVEDIYDIWYKRYEVMEDIPFNAFAIYVMMLLAGPDWFRYLLARCLDGFDKLGIRAGFLQPQCRILISRKRS